MILKTLVSEEMQENSDEIYDALESERLGMARKGVDMAGYYFDEEKGKNGCVYLLNWKYGESMDEIVVVGYNEVPLSHEPIYLTSQIEDYVDYVTEDILPEIETFGYPSASQQKFLDNMSENPSDPSTIAYLKSCKQCSCFCPLFFSVSCVSFHVEPIEDTGESISFTPKEGMRKRPIKRMVTSLRKVLSKDELSSVMNSLKSRNQDEEVLLRSYG